MNVLILCTGNSCRSQMAEGFFRHFLYQYLPNENHTVRSAGIETHGVNRKAVLVMGELGIDLSTHSSNNLKEYLNEPFDYVITVCDNAAENCPIFPHGEHKLHWPFEDPAQATGTEAEILDQFRKVRDQIGQKVEGWLKRLV